MFEHKSRKWKHGNKQTFYLTSSKKHEAKVSCSREVKQWLPARPRASCDKVIIPDTQVGNVKKAVCEDQAEEEARSHADTGDWDVLMEETTTTLRISPQAAPETPNLSLDSATAWLPRV